LSRSWTYLEFIAHVTSHIPDEAQATIRYYGLYANAHRGKVRKASIFGNIRPALLYYEVRLTFENGESHDGRKSFDLEVHNPGAYFSLKNRRGPGRQI
jgi:hypothetical protein